MRIPSGLPPGLIGLGSSLLRWSVVIFRSFFDNYLSRFLPSSLSSLSSTRPCEGRSASLLDDHAWWRAASTDLPVGRRCPSECGGQGGRLQELSGGRPSVQLTWEWSCWSSGMFLCSHGCQGLATGLYIGWQWSNLFISAVFRHFVGQALRNVCYSDVSRRHFLNKIAMVRTFS